jgi:hypothetical protein
VPTSSDDDINGRHWRGSHLFDDATLESSPPDRLDGSLSLVGQISKSGAKEYLHHTIVAPGHFHFHSKAITGKGGGCGAKRDLRLPLTDAYGKGAWQSAVRFPLHLRAVLIMAALNWSLERTQEWLRISDRRQPMVYLTLGACAWDDAKEQKVMTAG